MAAKNAVFEEWYRQQYDEWWKNRRVALLRSWTLLEEAGVAPDVVAEVFSTVSRAIRDQYGD